VSDLTLIGDIFKVSSGGTPSRKKEEYFLDGHIPWVKTGDLKGKFANKSTEFITQLGLEESSAKLCPPKTVLLAMYGATIGACSVLPFEAATNQACAAIFPIDNFSEIYLYYYFCSIKDVLVRKGVGGAQPNISLGIIKKIRIPLPPLKEQQKIADILDAADSLRQKDRQLIEHYTRLGQSLFLDMFGDPVINPMGWKSTKLENISDIVSGVTKGRKIKSGDVFDIPYMRVANVQAGYLDLKEVKTLPGTKGDISKFVLKQGDVLLTEGGDPDKLGRGTVWNNEIKNCIHQNHIFRVRLTCTKSIPIYLSRLCGSEYGKRYFLKSGKQTTGIASINKAQLNRFPVLRPPIELQNTFAQHIEKIEQQKQQVEANLVKSEALFNSLLQRAFKGELTGNS